MAGRNMIGKAYIKERLKNGEVLTWGTLRICEPALAEMMAIAGIDILVIDYAHYPFDEEKLCNIIRAADIYHTACIVRVDSPEPGMIGKVLECGAEGIQLALLSTAKQARALVDAVKFGPIGKRGLCPVTRAAGCGLAGLDYEEFARLSNEQTIIVGQVETKEGIENLDEILAIPEIDIFCGGKSDLSASYGFPGQNDHPLVVGATEDMKNKVKAAGKYLVTKANTCEEIEALRKEGAAIIGFSSDQQIIEALCSDYAVVSNQWSLPGNVQYNDQIVGFDYDPEKRSRCLPRLDIRTVFPSPSPQDPMTWRWMCARFL